MTDLPVKAEGTASRERADASIKYPRRIVIRWLLRWLTGLAFFLVSDFRVIGRHNIPANGPVLLVANHFHYSDPAVMLWISKRQAEFVGGFRFFVGPRYLHFLPSLWGIITAFRGGYSRQTLQQALSVLEQDGVLAIFPEGGAWASVLRPPRRGSAFLALKAGVPIVPVGIDGVEGLFRSLRPRITIRIGEPFGPFKSGKEIRERRRQLDEVGDQIMRAIAQLIPQERHGVYSSDARLRAEAMKVAEFPFEQAGMRGL